MKSNTRVADWLTVSLAAALASVGGSASGSWIWANDWQIPAYAWQHLGASAPNVNQVDFRYTAPKTGNITSVAPHIHYTSFADTTNWTVQFRADSAGNPGTVLASKTDTGANLFSGAGTAPETFWLANWALNVPVTAGSVYHLTISSPDTLTTSPYNDIEPGFFTGAWNSNQRSTDRTQDMNMATLTSTNSGASWTVQNAANGGGFLGGLKYSDGSAYGNGPYGIKTGEPGYYVYGTQYNGELFRYTGASLAESFIESLQV